MKPLLVLCALFLCVAPVFPGEGLRLRYERQDDEHGLVKGAATAFGIDLSEFGLKGDKWALTAGHNVVTGKKAHDKIQLKIDGEWRDCKVALYDPDTDLCLLRSSKALPERLKLIKQDVIQGDRIRISGSIKGGKVKDYKGKVLRPFFMGMAHTLAQVQFDHGLSGAPVLAKDGGLAGIATAGVPLGGDIDKGLALFVPASAIRTLTRSYLRALNSE